MSKPFAPACERNQSYILDVLQLEFAGIDSVLEMGSGTGQHAVYFAKALPYLTWQTSDRADYLPGIRLWLEEADLSNTPATLVLDCLDESWPIDQVDGVFTANTAHIMSWPAVCAMFAGVGRILAQGGSFCQYGPFQYQQQHTSASNQQFDLFLRQRDPASGIRDVTELCELAEKVGLALVDDHAMPSNNRLLHWLKAH